MGVETRLTRSRRTTFACRVRMCAARDRHFHPTTIDIDQLYMSPYNPITWHSGYHLSLCTHGYDTTTDFDAVTDRLARSLEFHCHASVADGQFQVTNLERLKDRLERLVAHAHDLQLLSIQASRGLTLHHNPTIVARGSQLTATHHIVTACTAVLVRLRGAESTIERCVAILPTTSPPRRCWRSGCVGCGLSIRISSFGATGSDLECIHRCVLWHRRSFSDSQ
jgi:hypothetical protein